MRACFLFVPLPWQWAAGILYYSRVPEAISTMVPIFGAIAFVVLLYVVLLIIRIVFIIGLIKKQ